MSPYYPDVFLGYRQNDYEAKLICFELLYSGTNLVVGSEKKTHSDQICLILYNVGRTIMNRPFENGLCHLSMVIWGMVYSCFTHINCFFKSMTTINDNVGHPRSMAVCGPDISGDS